MGGLCLVRDQDPDLEERALDKVRAQFVRHGFRALRDRRIPGWRVLHAGYIAGGPDTYFAEGQDFVAIAGTLVFDGEMGRPALQALLATVQPRQLDWSRFGGQFTCLVHKAGRSFLFTDFFSAFQVFHDSRMRLFSTSFLAAAELVSRVSFDAQGVYEYAFHCSILGNDTVLQELKRLGPDAVIELVPQGTIVHPVSRPLTATPGPMPLAARVSLHRGKLGAVVAGHTRHFGNHVQCPLSGGLDSRLLLAALRAADCRPRVYVYGPSASQDVRIARQIGRAEGFDVEWIEKERYRRIEPDEFPDQVARNFQENDALPNFGGLFDNGGNAAARDARHRDGALAASGGCGEVYRNFFYLPDRPLTASAVTRGFFARFDRRDATDAFDEGHFLRATEDKILAALQRPGDRSPLPRSAVEEIYPRIRGRALFGREISLEGRYGAYMMPFLDHCVAGEAAVMPMSLKKSGKFEALLLQAIDPALARHPSVYGHHFAEPPGMSHHLSEWLTCIRPVWLRQKSYAIQRRLRPMSDEHGGIFSDAYMGRVIDLSFPAMRRYFHVERITDRGLWRRIACLEYLAGYFGARLSAG
jgi:asparagine synthase (glutamine-hydrolysing)